MSTPKRKKRKRHAPQHVATSSQDAYETRRAHLKAAVYPSEKPVFEEMVRTVFGKTMSDFLRDYLTEKFEEAKRAGFKA